ncbi:MAG TPA: GlsB/YeaQ/YmgE family stress response membrane protein [Acetobacteraceae bacterium]|jgi:uncharacterized membrane protein YeaQ/YmgE (transglycosylase-associated protein family)|nr:GlsB/YeaQ/YmgE family stress response membrane protein [Acetobacteraceae bacterium]
MGWLAIIVLGLIAGWLASLIVDNGGRGPIIDIVLGLIGAIVGGAIFQAFGASGVTGFNWYSLLVAVIGAIVVLVIFHALMGRGRRRI